MTLDSSRIAIFTGEFGCGKSEIAINRAVELAVAGGSAALMDLDVVKAHFRSRQAAEQVRAAGVEMITPVGDLADFELPAINPRVPTLLRGSECRVIVDIGGGTEGTKVLRAFAKFMPAEDVAMYLVVNPYRPYSRTLDQIVSSYERISSASGRTIDAVLSNPHLGKQTDRGVIMRGHEIVTEVAHKLGCEVRALVVQSAIAKQLQGDTENMGVPIYQIELYLRPPWERRPEDMEDVELGETQDRCGTMQGL